MKPNISILVPTRSRPEKMLRLVQNVAGYRNIEVVIGVDEDDPTPFTAEMIPEGANAKIVLRPRHETLGAVFNTLASNSRGQWLMAMGDDYVIDTPDWPQIVLNCGKQLPRNAGVMYCRDPLHPGFPTIFCISRDQYAKLGYFVPPFFPYWFIDTWWDELAELTGIKMEMHIDVSCPDGRGKTQGLRDFPLWLQVFNVTRPMRVKDAIAILDMCGEKNYIDQVMQSLPQRQQVCANRVAHLGSPQFLAEVGSRAEGEPSERYLAAKKRGEELIEKMKGQQPRRARVAICIPSGRAWEAGTATDIVGLSAFSTLHGVELAILNVQTSMITNGRNGTVEMAMKASCDYLFWVDSDMRVPPDALVRLLKHNKDIVGATYNKRVPPYDTLGKMKGDIRSVTGDGLHEALLMPGGCMLVKMDVYKKLEWPWYWESYRWPGEDGLIGFKKLLKDYVKEVPPDDVLASLDGTKFGDWIATNYNLGEFGESFLYFSEDLSFCRKARKHGYQLWCDFGLTHEVKHIGVAEIPCRDPATLTVAEKQQLVAAGFNLPVEPIPAPQAAE